MQHSYSPPKIIPHLINERWQCLFTLHIITKQKTQVISRHPVPNVQLFRSCYSSCCAFCAFSILCIQNSSFIEAANERLVINSLQESTVSSHLSRYTVCLLMQKRLSVSIDIIYLVNKLSGGVLRLPTYALHINSLLCFLRSTNS